MAGPVPERDLVPGLAKSRSFNLAPGGRSEVTLAKLHRDVSPTKSNFLTLKCDASCVFRDASNCAKPESQNEKLVVKMWLKVFQVKLMGHFLSFINNDRQV